MVFSFLISFARTALPCSVSVIVAVGERSVFRKAESLTFAYEFRAGLQRVSELFNGVQLTEIYFDL